MLPKTSPAARCDVAGCFRQADMVSRFRRTATARALRRHDLVGPMGHVCAVGDNATMESFWSLVKTNAAIQQRWSRRQELRLAVVVWIERKYHRQPAQDALGALTPIEFEGRLTEPLTLAARSDLSPVRSSRPHDHARIEMLLIGEPRHEDSYYEPTSSDCSMRAITSRSR